MSIQPPSNGPLREQGRLTLLERLIDRTTINVDFCPHKIVFAIAALVGALSAAGLATEALSTSGEPIQAQRAR